MIVKKSIGKGSLKNLTKILIYLKSETQHIVKNVGKTLYELNLKCII